jgi:hypothetical protein
MTFWPAYKANRRFAAGQNMAEKKPTKGVTRLRFFKSCFFINAAIISRGLHPKDMTRTEAYIDLSGAVAFYLFLMDL